MPDVASHTGDPTVNTGNSHSGHVADGTVTTDISHPANDAVIVASVPLVAPGVGKPGDQYVKYKTPLAPYAKDVKACHAI